MSSLKKIKKNKRSYHEIQCTTSLRTSLSTATASQHTEVVPKKKKKNPFLCDAVTMNSRAGTEGGGGVPGVPGTPLLHYHFSGGGYGCRLSLPLFNDRIFFLFFFT